MEWQIASQTHVGKVRPINEDALLVVKDYPLLTVADGMGGHQAGEVASRMIVDDLAQLALSATLEEARAQAERALHDCNQKIVEYARQELNGLTIGSTAVTMLAQGDRAVCIWAGDSRLYRIRETSIEQLTEDHSHVAELLRDGLITAEEAINHPSGNVITRAVGAAPELNLSVISFAVDPGDTYLLCSDGLYSHVAEGEILRTVLGTDVYRSSVQLLNLCLQRPARDNLTCILAHATTSPGGTHEHDETLMDSTLPHIGS